MSSQAINLWKYKLGQMKEEKIAIMDEKGLQQTFLRDKMMRTRVLGIPFADDQRRALDAYRILQRYTAETSCRIGPDLIPTVIEDYYSNDEDYSPWGTRNNCFNHTINTQSPDFPQPHILHSYMQTIQKAVEIDGSALPKDLPAQPLTWTSDKERESVETFFAHHGLQTNQTIGLHLTAGSYDVYKNIWSQTRFVSLSQHFAERGYQILLITGSLADPLPPAERDKGWQIHQAFLDTLKSFPSMKRPPLLFYGTTLEDAEVIRRCAVFISAETGPAHLASAVGTPKVTIAASSFQAKRWMLTSQQDYGFISEGNGISAPTVEQMIAATESILSKQVAAEN